MYLSMVRRQTFTSHLHVPWSRHRTTNLDHQPAVLSKFLKSAMSTLPKGGGRVTAALSTSNQSFFCLSGSGEEGVLASDAFDGPFRHSTLHLEGADDVVFRADHARNITMHILVRILFFPALSIPVLSIP